FYPWLRQIALERLLDLRRRHVRARKRSVAREEPDVLGLPDESAAELAARLIDLGSSPSRHLLREELRERVRAALGRLSAGDREVLGAEKGTGYFYGPQDRKSTLSPFPHSRSSTKSSSWAMTAR